MNPVDPGICRFCDWPRSLLAEWGPLHFGGLRDADGIPARLACNHDQRPSEQNLRRRQHLSDITVGRTLCRVAFLPHGADRIQLHERSHNVKRRGASPPQVGGDLPDMEALRVEHVAKLIVRDGVNVIEDGNLAEFVDGPWEE